MFYPFLKEHSRKVAYAWDSISGSRILDRYSWKAAWKHLRWGLCRLGVSKSLMRSCKHYNRLEMIVSFHTALSSGPRFHTSFCTYQAEVVKHRDVREAVGLGCPLSIFTTNNSESLNASIKQKMDYKQYEWPQFNKLIRELWLNVMNWLAHCQGEANTG